MHVSACARGGARGRRFGTEGEGSSRGITGHAGAGGGGGGGGTGNGAGESLWHLDLKKMGWDSFLLEGNECTSFSS